MVRRDDIWRRGRRESSVYAELMVRLPIGLVSYLHGLLLVLSLVVASNEQNN